MTNKHFASYQGGNYIVLGYNDQRGKFLLLDPFRLTNSDQEWLGEIVQGDYAQARNNLRDALVRESHPSGQDGWSWCCARGVEIPVHDVTLADRQQSAEWLGVPSNHDPKVKSPFQNPDHGSSSNPNHGSVTTPMIETLTTRENLGVREPDEQSKLQTQLLTTMAGTISDLMATIENLNSTVEALKTKIGEGTDKKISRRKRPTAN